MENNDYFFTTIQESEKNRVLLSSIRDYANSRKQQIYVLSAPLTEAKYSYQYGEGMIILKSDCRIIFSTTGDVDSEEFKNYQDDVIDDIGSISDKFDYKEVIGRPRIWQKSLIKTFAINQLEDVGKVFEDQKLINYRDKKIADLLLSLFIGSINDVADLSLDEPENLLEKVKHKIQLFDGDQTRFIYSSPIKDGESKKTTIQGLSGTGKTELLLHKLKDIYKNEPKSRICFTCHNKILADELHHRIPSFFNFMKVDLQIEWEKRLWCVNAWGQLGDPNSGAYRYLCYFYNLPFWNLYQGSFKSICRRVLDLLKEMKAGTKDWKYAFTYMFVDESQDFDESFFEICQLVTEKEVFIAGDIFQSIFEDRENLTVKPDYLLSKCYRTDPKTLMFAHALGMGLFEDKKLWWLDEEEWKLCGYTVTVNQHYYTLSREPLRRFEDLDDDYESLQIIKTDDIIKDLNLLIRQLIEEYPTLQPADIGIILLDEENYIYELSRRIAASVNVELGWNVNIAYESKQKLSDKLLISNRNNVKGLEFPFVICYTRKILSSTSYRNALYTMLTRSFLKSFLIIPDNRETGLTDRIMEGAKDIMRDKKITVIEPSEEEKRDIKARFVMSEKNISFHDLVLDMLNQRKVLKRNYRKIFNGLEKFGVQSAEKEKLEAFIDSLIELLPDEDIREED